MEQYELLQFVAGSIEEMGLRYFVTGSIATIFYAEPRLTNDIDVVVDLSLRDVGEFCRRFSRRDLYVSDEAARQAVLDRTQFNIIDPESGVKVDVIVPESSAFNESRFARARRVLATGEIAAWFSSPEDAIIKKMEYYREGGSEKHLRDIASVLTTSRSQIDMAYIDRWAGQFGLDDLWHTIQERLKPKG